MKRGKRYWLAWIRLRRCARWAGGRRAIGRTLAFPLSFLILCLGFLGILLGDRRRALHDAIAGTVVIYCWDARAARLRFLSRPRYSAAPRPGSSDQVGPPADPAR